MYTNLLLVLRCAAFSAGVSKIPPGVTYPLRLRLPLLSETGVGGAIAGTAVVGTVGLGHGVGDTPTRGGGATAPVRGGATAIGGISCHPRLTSPNPVGGLWGTVENCANDGVAGAPNT